MPELPRPHTDYLEEMIYRGASLQAANETVGESSTPGRPATVPRTPHACLSDMRPDRDLTRGDAVLIIDVQVDLCPGGAVAVPQGDRVVPVLNAWLRVAHERGLPIYATRDWHPQGHPSFSQLPSHCLQDSGGAAFHPDLALPSSTVIVTKGVHLGHAQLSAFDDTGLEVALSRQGVRRLFVGGLPLEHCVRASILDAARFGLRAMLIPGGTRARDPARAERVIFELERAGVIVERDAAAASL